MLIAVVMVFTPYFDPSITYGLMVLVLQASAALNHYFHPYALSRDNRLQVGATCVVLAARLVCCVVRHRKSGGLRSVMCAGPGMRSLSPALRGSCSLLHAIDQMTSPKQPSSSAS